MELGRKQMRNNLILEMFRQSKMGVCEFSHWLTEQPAPCFFVEYEDARRNVSLILRGKPAAVNLENPHSRVYIHIAERLQKHPHYISGKRYRYSPIMDILEEPAPSFYLDEETIKGLIYRNLRKKRKRL